MLCLELQDARFYDESTNRVFTIKGRKLVLEHSLVSLSKWESKYKKPFLSKIPKTLEETRYYVECMTITQNVPPETYMLLTNEDIDKINAYIDDSMTAMTYTPRRRRQTGEYITAETFYYWMIQFNIPDKCEKWHLNRLMALITFCSEKNAASNKNVNRKQTLNDMVSLNESRLNRLNKKK